MSCVPLCFTTLTRNCIRKNTKGLPSSKIYGTNQIIECLCILYDDKVIGAVEVCMVSSLQLLIDANILDYTKETPPATSTVNSDSKARPAVDPVLASKLLMDQLSQKSTPAGVTAAMLAALATASSSSGMSEQKRLLLELEKKVEEQKKLIEMQKVNTKISR